MTEGAEQDGGPQSHPLSVQVARAARVVRGSIRGLADRLSPTHTESRPAASARKAISTTGLASFGGSSLITSALVGRRTPSFSGVAVMFEVSVS